MTDLLEELTTPGEEAPDVPGPELTEALTARCRYCDETFSLGRGGAIMRGRHERKEHREEWERDTPKWKIEQLDRQADARAEGRSQKSRLSTRKTPAIQPAPGPRQSAADMLTMAVKGLSWLMGAAHSPATPWFGPMSVMTSFEAPIAGAELDRAAAGTVVDKLVLQRVMTSKDRLEAVAPLVAAPALVGLIAAHPEALPELKPMLRYCLMPMLPQLVEEMRRQRDETEMMMAQARELAAMDPSFAELFSAGGDPLDAIIDAIFPAPPPQSQPGPQVEPDPE